MRSRMKLFDVLGGRLGTLLEAFQKADAGDSAY